MAGGSQKLFPGMDQGSFAQAQQFANQGNWGEAAQAYQQGGGQGFTQPQAQAFTQQYGMTMPQLGSIFQPQGGQNMGPTQWAAPQPQPIGEYTSNDNWIPPQQAPPPGAIAQPTAPSYQPPPQMLPPTPTAPLMPKPQAGPNWSSYVQGNPDLINAYNQGSPQSIGDWGKSHWESFGQNESRAVNPYSGLLA